MGTSTINVIVKFATGTAPEFNIYNYGYSSLTVLLGAFFIVFFIIILYWLEDWLLIGIETIINSIRAGRAEAKKRRDNK